MRNFSLRDEIDTAVVVDQKTYTAGLGVIKNVGVVVDSLYRLSENLHA